MPPNQQVDLEVLRRLSSSDNDKIKVAILGCGMMGQEHISFISGYSTLQIDFLCDPYKPSLDKALQVMERFNNIAPQPMLLTDESDLLTFADAINLLIIALPNYLHTDSLTKWGEYNLSILCEKPVAVSQPRAARCSPEALIETYLCCLNLGSYGILVHSHYSQATSSHSLNW
jgi:myo-inositol 2-dehydrogenase/D-chiro-inositol 1-dehydrogenase